MSERYDAVIVGGGVGGLVTGAFLAKAGRSVLVLEAEAEPGGYARSFASDGWSFDLADHVLMSCNEGGPFGEGFLHRLLGSLGVADRVRWVALDPFHTVHHRGRRFVIPGGREAHVEALSTYFPRHERGIRELFATYDRAYREITEMPVDARFRDLASMPLRFPHVFRWRRRTVAELFAEHFDDPDLREVHAALWPYVGLPPSRASAVVWQAMVGSYAAEGAFYAEGGFQRLVDALAEGLRRHGGELRCGERVVAVRVTEGAVRSVTTSGGREIATSMVVASIDPRELFGSMLAGGRVPDRYRRKLEGDVSGMAYALYLAVNLDLDRRRTTHEMTVASEDAETCFREGQRGEVRGVVVTTPSLTDRSRSPTGHQTVVIKAVCPRDGVQRDPEPLARSMISLAEQAMPGLRDGIVHVHGRTDREPWPLRRLGPMYGWAITPRQTGLYRLGHSTPIAGLYLAGHWTRPAAGVWGAAASAVQLVRSILGRAPHAGLVPLRL